VFAPGRGDLDITDPAAFAAVLAARRPAAVINAAAVSQVDRAETEPGRVEAVNAVAPGRMAQACAAAGVPLIHVSSDYVFGAATDRPWTEADPVSPINAYGRLKVEGEARVRAAGGRSCTVRVAWLFGDGEDFIAGLLRRGAGTSARVAEDQIGSPTPIHALAERMLALADRLIAGDPAIPPILHLAGSPPVSRADWVEAAFQAVVAAGGRPPPLIRARMADFPSAAPRPTYSALDSGRAAELFGGALDWRAALAGAFGGL